MCNAVSPEHLAKVERDGLTADEGRSGVFGARWGAYEREVVVCILELCVVGIDFVDEKGDCLFIFIAFDGPACALSAVCP